jgi:fructose-1,6-bisphosphatase
MASSPTLDQFLDSSAQQDPSLEELVPIIRGIAEAGISLSDLISRHGLIDYLDKAGDENSDGDLQTPLDIMAHNIFEAALRQLPVSFLASEEQVEILEIDSRAAYGVAIDPLDGSSNIETKWPSIRSTAHRISKPTCLSERFSRYCRVVLKICWGRIWEAGKRPPGFWSTAPRPG